MKKKNGTSIRKSIRVSRQRRYYDSVIVKRRRRGHFNNGKEDKNDLNSRAYKARRWRKAADSWVDDDNHLYARQPRRKGDKKKH